MKHRAVPSRKLRTPTAVPVPRAVRAALLVGTLGLSCSLLACNEPEPPARQPPPVTVVKPTVSTIREQGIFTGTSRAVESADVVARVAGALETVDFEPSTPVKAGALLFTIEDTRYRAERAAAHAALQSAQADLARTETELRRLVQASESRAVSEMDVDRARADRDMAAAAVGLARADLDNADLNLSYTRVEAPFDGFVSRNLVDVGNLVGQSGPTVLTRINKLQPIFVYFNAPETLVLDYLAAGKRDEAGGGEAWVALANEDGYPHRGVVDFIDNQVNARTGTIEMRVRLANADLAIFPGLFVRVKLVGAEIPDAVLVPEVAVATDLAGKYVLTVDEDGLVAQRFVTLGAAQDSGLVHIADGLDGDETVIVNGLLRARPGRPVTPLTPAEAEAQRQQAAAAKQSGRS